MGDHYGEEWRHWPGGCKCHGEGDGYMQDYRSAFAAMFDRIDRYFLMVEPSGDAGEVWRWSFGAFSWTPFGDLLETIGHGGISPTRARAEAECRQAAEMFIARVAALR